MAIYKGQGFFFLKREEDMDNKIMSDHGDGTKVANIEVDNGSMNWELKLHVAENKSVIMKVRLKMN